MNLIEARISWDTAIGSIRAMVAKGKARIRAMVRADMSKEDLDFAVEKFEKIGKELQIIK